MILLSYFLAAVWFFLPGGVSNATPVVANYVPLLKDWGATLDFGASYRGKRVFGTNKTWRGLVCGVVLGTATAYLQYLVGPVSHSPHLGLWQAVGAGLLMSSGALLGDAIESFFKRQRGTAPGDRWFPLDQLDYIFGGLLLSYPVAHPSWRLMVAVVATWFGVHLLVVYLGYLAGIRDKPI